MTDPPTPPYSTVMAHWGETERPDAWWLPPLATILALGIFVVYATWAAFENAHYRWGPYVSPFYSPFLRPTWIPGWVSPALLILVAPLGLRATCYYFRKAYYRSFFQHPPACAVAEESDRPYAGERRFPLTLQHLHRYFLYMALLLVGNHWIDVGHALVWDGQVGMGLGTLVLMLDAALLTCYVFGCHSLRHLVGGRLDCFHCERWGPSRFRAWQGVGVLNRHHGVFGWASLLFVAFADFYVRMLAMGIWQDLRFF